MVKLGFFALFSVRAMICESERERGDGETYGKKGIRVNIIRFNFFIIRSLSFPSS